MGSVNKISRSTPYDLLPPSRFHILKVPHLSQIVPLPEDQVLRHMSQQSTVHIQTTIHNTVNKDEKIKSHVLFSKYPNIIFFFNQCTKLQCVRWLEWSHITTIKSLCTWWKSFYLHLRHQYLNRKTDLCSACHHYHL